MFDMYYCLIVLRSVGRRSAQKEAADDRFCTQCSMVVGIVASKIILRENFSVFETSCGGIVKIHYLQ